MERHASPHALGLAHFTVLEAPPLELVTIAASIGYAAIGLRLHPAFPGAPFYELPAGGALLRDVKARLDGESVRVHDIEFVVLDNQLEVASLEPILASAAELGASRLSVCGDDAQPHRMAERFAALCRLAARYGMGVDLECMAWRKVASVSSAAAVVLAAGQPNGGILVDALHLSRTGGSPRDLADIPESLLVSAQLCDAPLAIPASMDAIIAEARGGRLAPGDGGLPLTQLVDALPAHTVLSIEAPMGSGGPALDRAASLFNKTTALLDRRLPKGRPAGA